MKKWLLVLLMGICFTLSGQEKIPVTDADYTNQEVPMADKLRQSGKIYVLTGIILIVLGGTIGYLISIDRKVGKLEKALKDK